MKNKLIKISTLIIVFVATISAFAQKNKEENHSSKSFEPTFESFKQNYKCPDWFRDAKFGIWAHWGPQAVPRQGDWYAKNLYDFDRYDKYTKTYTGKPQKQALYHLDHYGHPSKFGYKDIIPLWKAERFNPEQLMALYKRVGAKYFVSMATHHDNFFLWNSKIHRWNSVNMGPKKDIVGLFQAAARKEGLRFGVSEHLAASYTWFQTSHGTDKAGELAGVPYDGNGPINQDLYHKKAAPDDNQWLTNNPENQQNWLKSISELIDNYHPDLLYSDSHFPFDSVGRQMVSHFYNDNMDQNKGKLEAVYNCKGGSSNPMWVLDIERGLTDSITSYPWQTDTSIGDWYYRTGQKYKSGSEIIQMLVDIVSKNGNLLINVVQTPEGDLEPDVLNILEDIASWNSVNGEGIFGSRPWKVYGEGPSVVEKKDAWKWGGISDVRKKPYTETDFRFTSKGNDIYAFCMAKPTGEICLSSFGKNSKLANKAIASVKILGSSEKLVWKQSKDALVISKPTNLPNSETIAFKITLKK
jgi:alpha-L-fucosidase